jgi:hypothetical protein
VFARRNARSVGTPVFLVATRIVASGSISRLLPPGDVDLLFHFPAHPLSAAYEFLPVNFFSRNHGKDVFDLRADFICGVPVLPVRECSLLINIVEPFVQSSHAGLDFLQVSLTIPLRVKVRPK